MSSNKLSKKPVPQIALLGGGFDPPTLAHQQMVEFLLAENLFDQVWLIPYQERAFGKQAQTAARHRLAMAKLLAEPFAPRATVCEYELRQTAKSYTIDTVNYLQTKYPEYQFSLVLGSDLLKELPKWKDIDELAKLLSFICLPRVNYPVLKQVVKKYQIMVMPEAHIADISSTQVRLDLKQEKKNVNQIPKSIRTYIRQHSLYG